jgi:hypothetical protein
MINQHKNKFDKRQALYLSLVIVATILIVVVVFWYFFKDLGKSYDDVNSTSNPDSTTQENMRESTPEQINPSNLPGSYVGLRESIDGSVEAVLLQIEKINESDYSFEYVLNIGTNQKFSGIGKMNIQKDLLISDMIGEMNYSVDTNGSIILITPDSGSKAIYKLIREKQ